MSYEDDKARAIAISVGINNAAVLAAGAESPIAAFDDIVEGVVERVIGLHEKYAIEDLQAAFPGSTVQAPVQQFGPATAPAAAPAYTPPAPAPVVPAAIPGAADGDPATVAYWQELLTAYQEGKVARAFGAAQNGQWFDNRGPGQRQGSPDFKKKGVKGEDTPALWLQGKKNPSWLPTALQQVGLA